MQLDMHFYGVYALARAAGIKDKAAETIAYASQLLTIQSKTRLFCFQIKELFYRP